MNEDKKDITFKKVSISDAKFLFALLKEREKIVNISHIEMPTYKKHIEFIKSNPYSYWYIIKYKNCKVGSIYLSRQNEIGIFVKDEFQKKQIGNRALEKIIELTKKKRYLANINPKNKDSICFFKKNGFNLIQYTYELYPSRR